MPGSARSTIKGAQLGQCVGEISKPTARIKIVRTAGGIVTQLGDREAAGPARLACLEKLLEAIGAYRVTSDESNAMNALRTSERFKRFGALQVPAGTRTVG